MVLVIEKKFLEGTWWKYGLALAAGKLALWVALVFHRNPDFSAAQILQQYWLFYGTFAVSAFLPFVVGRLQMRRLFWCALSGFFIAEAAYLFLIFVGFGARFNLLPFIAYMQLYVTFFSLGLVIELGRFVYMKVME
jgi:hypothetical protein